MADNPSGLADAEFARRCAALQAGMKAEGMDALLLTSPADIFYVTGFLTRFWESPARPWFVVIPANARPVAVIPAIGEALMARCWTGEIRTWPAPDPQDDGVSLLSDTLAALVPENGRIGLPMGLETCLRMPVADYARVMTRLAPRAFVDATHTVQRVREIKSEAEIARIRTICGIADAAYHRVPEFATEGTGLDAVFRRFQSVLLEQGADWVSYVAGGAGPGGYGDVISPAPRTPLQRGDVLMLDTGAVRDGYFCDFDRNWAIGKAPEESRRAHAALWSATETALETLRPGMLACDVHRILCDALRAQGAVPGGGRLGHGLGVTLTEWPSFTDRDTTELREGMVLTLEPGVEIGAGRIIVHEENIVLRASGPELLSRRAPSDLPVIVS
ncbi:M24 family metallopeptidase [Maliponia aquimaris]|uniref:Putative peptidase n=1 Tax=Maliponia aquimaris TaxID=1673631 RepID=A0A238L0C5_9RHOB|nr:Xaa-Pro peptidase family protein [Maliponia aquimaris]SMX48534.1 putative peptidase [Maliponia aquimaris]